MADGCTLEGRRQSWGGGDVRRDSCTRPWSHQSNPEWMLPRITEESGGGHGWATAVPGGWSVGLLRAGAEGFRREEVRQEPTQTAGDGGRAQLTWLKPLDCGESSVVGRVDVDADRCAEVQVLALPLGCEDGSGDALQRPQGQAPGCAHKSRCPRMFLSHEQHPPCAPEQETSMGSPALGRGT